MLIVHQCILHTHLSNDGENVRDIGVVMAQDKGVVAGITQKSEAGREGWMEGGRREETKREEERE